MHAVQDVLNCLLTVLPRRSKRPFSSSGMQFVVISDITQAELLSVPLANLQAKLTVHTDSSMHVQNTSNGEVTIKQGMQLVGFGKIGFRLVQDWGDVNEYEVEVSAPQLGRPCDISY